MKCRDVAKVLPDLAANELSEEQAREALAHIRACRSCAAEWAKYTKALGDLSQPRGMADVPEALSALRLPEASGFRLRPVIAAVGLAMVLALVVLLPGLHHRAVQEQPIARDTQRVERSMPPVVREPSKPSEAAEKSGRSAASEPGRPARPRKHFVRIQEKGIPTRPIVTSPTPEAPVEEPDAMQMADAQIIVVASWIEPPSVIEIESVDYATGVVRVFKSASSFPEGEQVIEFESTTESVNNRREPI